MRCRGFIGAWHAQIDVTYRSFGVLLVSDVIYLTNLDQHISTAKGLADGLFFRVWIICLAVRTFVCFICFRKPLGFCYVLHSLI